MEKYLYHICTLQDWEKARETRSYRGTVRDVRRGYIPMCYQSQVKDVVQEKFQGKKDLVLVIVDFNIALKHLKQFHRNSLPEPLFYGILGFGDITSACKLRNNSKGNPILPDYLKI